MISKINKFSIYFVKIIDLKSMWSNQIYNKQKNVLVMLEQVFPIVAAMLTYLHTVNTSWRHSGFRNSKTYRGILPSSGS